MKVPSNMTEKEVIQLIQKVSKRVAHKYTFGVYDKDDIEQEAFILGMECLERYDEERPLENFLQVHISNRLHNLRRKEHYTKTNEDKKRPLLEPINISKVRDYDEPSMMYKESVETNYITKDMQGLIDLFLSTEYRLDYIKIKDGVYVPKARREEVLTEVRKILTRNGYIPEDWCEYDE